MESKRERERKKRKERRVLVGLVQEDDVGWGWGGAALAWHTAGTSLTSEIIVGHVEHPAKNPRRQKKRRREEPDTRARIQMMKIYVSCQSEQDEDIQLSSL